VLDSKKQIKTRKGKVMHKYGKKKGGKKK